MVNFLDEVPLCLGSNTPGFPKQLSNSAAGTKQANPCSLQGWIARQKIEQGSGTWGVPSRALVKTDASPRCRFRRVWITLLMTGWSIPPCVQANKQLSN